MEFGVSPSFVDAHTRACVRTHTNTLTHTMGCMDGWMDEDEGMRERIERRGGGRAD